MKKKQGFDNRVVFVLLVVKLRQVCETFLPCKCGSSDNKLSQLKKTPQYEGYCSG